MKSGIYCRHPTGKTSLVVPTQAVISWTDEHPKWGAAGYVVADNSMI
jgi:hypothetical protein